MIQSGRKCILGEDYFLGPFKQQQYNNNKEKWQNLIFLWHTRVEKLKRHWKGISYPYEALKHGISH